MHMGFIFWRGSNEPKLKSKWRIIGNPLGAVAVLLVVTCLIGFMWSVVKYLKDGYFPYEGEVIAITRSWPDWLFLEENNQEHLIIKTPEGDTIDRVVSMQTRSLQRIEVGDYVVKKRGMRKRVRPRGKMTTHELRSNINAPNKPDKGDGL